MCSLRVQQLSLRLLLLLQCYTILWLIPWGFPVALPWPSTWSSRGLGTAAAGFPHSLSPCLLPHHAKKRDVVGSPRGSAPTGETEDPLEPQGIDSAIPAPMTTLTHMSPWVTTQGDISSFTHVTHPLLQPTVPKTPEVASMCMFPLGLSQLHCQINFFLYRRE